MGSEHLEETVEKVLNGGGLEETVEEVLNGGGLEETVEKVLNGGGLEVTAFDSEPEELRAVVLRRTVCYIVCAVIFNAKGEVLMVQEAKRECYGRWYLPAGRMEQGESIQEAVQREVKEEAGVDCQLVTMLLLQEQGPQWIRFTFLAEATGGTLKTTAEADSESLQAQWWDREAPLPLRSRDILTLIDAGLKYRQKPWFPACQPVDLPCEVVCQRLLLVFTSTITNHENSDHLQGLWLLLGRGTVDSDAQTCPHLPVVAADKSCSVMLEARRLVRDCMGSSHHALQVNICGVLGVQHNGRVPGKTDGLCFNTLMTLKYSEGAVDLHCPPPLENERYIWHELTNQSMRANILQKIKDVSLLPVQTL